MWWPKTECLLGNFPNRQGHFLNRHLVLGHHFPKVPRVQHIRKLWNILSKRMRQNRGENRQICPWPGACPVKRVYLNRVNEDLTIFTIQVHWMLLRRWGLLRSTWHLGFTNIVLCCLEIHLFFSRELLHLWKLSTAQCVLCSVRCHCIFSSPMFSMQIL